MLSAEEFIKQHSKAQKQKSGMNSEVRTYDLKFYRSRNEIAKEIGVSRQTVAKRMGDL